MQPHDGRPDFEAMLQIVHPDDRAEVERRIRASTDTHAQTQAEFRIVWPDGSVRWLASRSAPVRR